MNRELDTIKAGDADLTVEIIRKMKLFDSLSQDNKHWIQSMIETEIRDEELDEWREQIKSYRTRSQKDAWTGSDKDAPMVNRRSQLWGFLDTLAQKRMQLYVSRDSLSMDLDGSRLKEEKSNIMSDAILASISDHVGTSSKQDIIKQALTSGDVNQTNQAIKELRSLQKLPDNWMAWLKDLKVFTSLEPDHRAWLQRQIQEAKGHDVNQINQLHDALGQRITDHEESRSEMLPLFEFINQSDHIGQALRQKRSELIDVIKQSEKAKNLATSQTSDIKSLGAMDRDSEPTVPDPKQAHLTWIVDQNREVTEHHSKSSLSKQLTEFSEQIKKKEAFTPAQLEIFYNHVDDFIKHGNESDLSDMYRDIEKLKEPRLLDFYVERLEKLSNHSVAQILGKYQATRHALSKSFDSRRLTDSTQRGRQPTFSSLFSSKKTPSIHTTAAALNQAIQSFQAGRINTKECLGVLFHTMLAISLGCPPFCGQCVSGQMST